MDMIIQQTIYILFWVGFYHIVQGFPMRPINYKDFPAYPVMEGCPLEKKAWENASEILNCTKPKDGLKNRYHCMPNRHKTMLLEFCYPRDRVRMSPGLCFVLADNGVITKYDDTNCTDFTNDSCPISYDEANMMYKYPACLKINPNKGCYTSDPACPNVYEVDSTKASETTTIDIPETSGITNSSVENQGHPAKEEKKDSATLIIIIIVSLVVVVAVVIVAGIIYQFCYKKKRICTKNGPSPEEIELLVSDAVAVHLDTSSPVFSKYYSTKTIKARVETSNEHLGVEWQRRAVDSDNALCIIIDEIKYTMCTRDIGENTTMYELSIHQLTEEDNGYYKCTVAETASEEVHLCIVGNLDNKIEWPSDDDSFKEFDEDLRKRIDEKLQEKDIMLLVGIPGSGKTALARHIALRKYEFENILNLSYPGELKSGIRNGTFKNKLIIFDDPFGKTMVNICNIIYFLVHFRCIEKLLRNVGCKVILTCREHIFEEIQKYGLDFQDCKINIPPYSYVTSKEKSRSLEEILDTDNNPLRSLLSLFYEQDKEITTCMTNACNALVEYFRDKRSEPNPYKYLCILICFMNENGLFTYNQSLDEHVRKLLDTTENPWEEISEQMKSFCSVQRLFARRKIGDHDIYTCKQIYILEAFSCYLKKYEQDIFFTSSRNEYKFCHRCPFCGAVDCTGLPIMENISKLSKVLPACLENNDFSALYCILNQCENKPEIKNALMENLKIIHIPDMLSFKDRAILIQSVKDIDNDAKNNVSGNVWEDIELLRLELLFQNARSENIRYICTKYIFWTVTFGILEFIDNIPSFEDNDVNRFKDNDVNRLIVLACFSGKESVDKALSLLEIKDVENVRYYRKKAESPFLCQKIEIPPLHVAVARNKLDLACYLISKEAAIDAVDHRNSTAMMIAAEKENYEMLKKLIENKGNVNLSDIQSKTPLYLAAAKGNKEIVKLLLEREASVDHRDLSGLTPLSLASQNGHAEIVELLVEKNAYVNQCDDSKTTPLLHASKYGHADVVKYLLKRKADLNIVDNFCRSPLMVAIIKMQENVIKLLLNKKGKIDVSQCDVDGKSPLHFAVEHNLQNVTKLLVSAKFSVNVADKHKQTPLHIACKLGYCDLAEYLVHKTALVNKKDKSLRSPLHYAVTNGHLDVVEFLLKNGADVDSCDENNRTPIYLASIKKSKQIVKSLMKNGADVDICDNDGVWPLDIAINDEKIFKELAKTSKRLEDPKVKNHLLINCAKNGKDNIINFLLTKSNADVNCTDEEDKNKTPLYYASVSGKFETVKLLIRNSGNVNAEDSDGITPLHVAAGSGNLKIVEHLVRSGALVNKTDNEGKTPLTCAEDADNSEEVISILEKYRTDK